MTLAADVAENWENYVRSRFPAYLFPSAQQARISEAEALRFLRHFSGDAADLELVTDASLFAAPEKQEALHALVRETADLSRNLPSTAVVHSRLWDGAYRGRLDVAGTLAFHVAGQNTRFVTRDRHRTHILAQTVLVRGVLERLLTSVRKLREQGVATREHWGARVLDVESELRQLLHHTPLRHVPAALIGTPHVEAARAARHRAYGLALAWHHWFEEAKGSPSERAKHLAKGALAPLVDDKRFEVAVLLRLVEGLRGILAEPDWQFEHSAILAGRDAVATFRRADGTMVEVLFNQVRFPTLRRDDLLARYFGAKGRMRPDITVVLTRPEEAPQALVVEVKLSKSDSYLRSGLEEALFYRHEFGPHLLDSPMAVLVADTVFHEAPKEGEEVIACSWERWPDPVVLRAIERTCG
ncbi:hypothetical protein HI113_00270 [Corallococcus exiguus]|uniref:hypothetical protein n=1 Tax=Corallococcus exiguus TaxID=83462 RepID=UPI001475F1B2|nr:hypothetical protein [Corallococcus exiguus]NNB92356.1 hypothetical protein [Corallococcus exiguus]